MTPQRPALSALNVAVLRLLSAGRDPRRELSLEDQVVVEALGESNKIGRGRSTASQTRWLDARIEEVCTYFDEHGFRSEPWLVAARCFEALAVTRDRRARSFAVDYKVLAYVGWLCRVHRVTAPVVASRNAVDYCNCDRRTVDQALLRLALAGLLHLKEHRFGRRVHLSESSRKKITPGDRGSDSSYGNLRTPSALYERQALGPRGEWLMQALATGPKSPQDLVSQTGFTRKVVSSLVDRAVSIEVAEVRSDGRYQIVPNLDVARVCEVTGASKWQQVRRELIEEDRAWYAWQEAALLAALERHGLDTPSDVRPGGMRILVPPRRDRSAWRERLQSRSE